MKNKGIKLIIAFAPLFFLASKASANAVDEVTKVGDPGLMEWALYNIVLLIGAGVIALAFWAVFYLNNMLLQVQKIRLLQELGIEVMEEVKLLHKEPWWKRLYKKATKAIPLEKEADHMLDHNYDGIRELDNDLPPWWVALFYITTIFAIGYMGYYHVFNYGLSQEEAYEVTMKEAEEAVKAHLANQANLVDETNVEPLLDELDLAMGKSIFDEKCTPCHGQVGEGNSIGPNLTDDYWIHGGNIKKVFRTIKYGVPEKGMISWKSQLRATDMHRVASYILSLKGTNPPNAKEAQGTLWQGE